jgi:hypothetical protein
VVPVGVVPVPVPRPPPPEPEPPVPVPVPVPGEPEPVPTVVVPPPPPPDPCGPPPVVVGVVVLVGAVVGELAGADRWTGAETTRARVVATAEMTVLGLNVGGAGSALSPRTVSGWMCRLEACAAGAAPGAPVEETFAPGANVAEAALCARDPVPST